MANGNGKKEVKNAVVDVKCKKTAEECKDADCPVHGGPKPEELPAPGAKAEDELTPSAQAAPPGTVCVHVDGNTPPCGQPRAAHTVATAKGDVAFDHDFLPAPLIGDEKVAEVEAAGKAIAEGAIEKQIDVHSLPATTPDPELVKFVMSKGYSEPGALSLLADRGDEIAADYKRAKAADVIPELLEQAASVIQHMQSKDEFAIQLIARIEEGEDSLNTLMDAQRELQKIKHHNEFTTTLLARIAEIL